MDGMNLADFKTVLDGNDSWNGGGILWFIIIALIFGGGMFGFGGNRQAATTDELSAGFANNAVLNRLNELTLGQANINQNLGNAICSSTYELGSKIDNCCCNTQLGIQGIKFDMANYASAIQMNDTANTQKVLDKLCGMELAQEQRENANLRNRVLQLENQAQIAAATCNIPRINTDGWGVFAYPTCAGAYGYANNCCPSI